MDSFTVRVREVGTLPDGTFYLVAVDEEKDLQALGRWVNAVMGQEKSERRPIVVFSLNSDLGKIADHPMVDLLRVARAAWHLCNSGLFNVDNRNCLIAEDLVRELRDALDKAFLKAGIGSHS